MRGERFAPGPQRYGSGLDDLDAGPTAICRLDGRHGALRYRGYDAAELAAQCSFEQVSYLVLYGELPQRAGLAAWSAELGRWRQPPAEALAALDRVPARAHPLAKYRTMLTVAACIAEGVEREGDDVDWTRPARILSWSSSLAAAAIRHLQGEQPVAPRGDLSHAESFLYQALGRLAAPGERKAFEASLVVQAEHGLHAAALAALTVLSTGADLGSAVLAGTGALSGARHGGANQLAFEAIEALPDARAGRRWAREALARGHRFAGFGHRVYKCPDPRVAALEPHAEALLTDRGLRDRWEIYLAIKQEVEAALAPKGIYANVDAVTGLIYHALGLPTPAFPIPFCLAIQTGWMAHCLEYQAGGAMIEPGAVYLGAVGSG